MVERPARRYGVIVDRSILDALVEDAPKEDALPLLAFALRMLFDIYRRLTKEDYDRVGRLKGVIEDAAERALAGIAATGGTVEIAHEALFREWSRLRLWLEPQRALLEALRSLQVDAGNWERSGKDGDFLNHR